MLNKYPIIANHFILATREWKAQVDLLERGDLEATFACIKAWRSSHEQEEEGVQGKGEGGLFAFFNSGTESGASQPHRHIQFLPIEAMRTAQEGEGELSSRWQPLIDVVAGRESYSREGFLYDDRLPFAHFAQPLPPNPSAETLHSIYLSLYRAAVAVASEGSNSSSAESDHGPAAIDYNLAMTEAAMIICPRRNGSATISVQGKEAKEVVEPGVISLNGTILGGTLMVKMEAEWEELRREPELLSGVLGRVGYPVGGRASL